MDIVGIGSPVMDLVVNVPHFPQSDGFVMARDIFYQGGGKVASGMVAAARLGARAGMLARVGGDFTGDFILKDFQYNGVDVSRILRGASGTSSPYCISLSEMERGSRVFIGRDSTAHKLTEGELDYGYIASARCLHLEDGDEASVAAAKFAKKNGITVSVDGDHYSPEMESVLPYVDVFIGSEFYHSDRFGGENYRKSCEEICSAGLTVAWFTLGKKGCVGLVDGVYHEIGAYPVEVVDTTGAGDVFHGAYLVAMLEGQTHDDCARFASAVSAIKCTYVGGRTGIPNRRTLDLFMESGVIDTAEFEERLCYYRTTL